MIASRHCPDLRPSIPASVVPASGYRSSRTALSRQSIAVRQFGLAAVLSGEARYKRSAHRAEPRSNGRQHQPEVDSWEYCVVSLRLKRAAAVSCLDSCKGYVSLRRPTLAPRSMRGPFKYVLLTLVLLLSCRARGAAAVRSSPPTSGAPASRSPMLVIVKASTCPSRTCPRALYQLSASHHC